MLTVTICDDSIKEIEEILVLLEGYAYGKKRISIQTFNSSMSLVKTIEAGNVSDIYLLDIVMPGFSGIDIGSIIRSKNKDAAIIFFTNSQEYALNAYELSALQYLVKPVKKSALYDALNKAVLILERRDKVFFADTPDGIIPIKYSDIIYVEYTNHVMSFQTISKTILSKYIRVQFALALEELLKEHNFIQTHRAFVVNIQLRIDELS